MDDKTTEKLDEIKKFVEEQTDRKMVRHDVFMRTAHTISDLATCDRKHVGAVAVKNNRIVSHGYNGAPSGFAHCDEVGHLMHEDHCRRVVHAEANLVAFADRRDLTNATVYVTCTPCPSCFMLLANAGVKAIYYDEGYREDSEIFQQMRELANDNDIELQQISYHE